ncbi:MAG: hypothetical protein AMXMBFR7_36390 [Planctomycetota bacterium]
MVWSNDGGLALPSEIKAKAREGLSLVAHWAARNQVRHRWPHWSANTGRFPYHVHLPSGDHFWSTSWNTARMVQGLISAYLILKEPEFLYAVECGIEYIKSIQFFGPEAPEARGYFLAETPVSEHAGSRDSIECVQALLAHYYLSKDPVSLQRAQAYLDTFVANLDNGTWPEGPMVVLPRLKPSHFIPLPRARRTLVQRWCDFVCAQPLLQLAAITGDVKYLKAANTLGDCILTHLCKHDGRICAKDSGHHTSSPDGALDNDDGIVLALLALHRVTGRNCFLDASVANAEWWMRRETLPPNFTTLSVLMMIMADLARTSGETSFADFIAKRAPEFFALQVRREERPLVAGAFRGEDMAHHYRQGSSAADFISLRSTSYGALALGRLACDCGRDWNPAYSAFGW